MNQPSYPKMIEDIAKVCHQANKAWCEAHGDHSQKDWSYAEGWQRESAIKGVLFRIDNPTAGDDAQHNSWMQEKVDAGWVYGEVKDAEAKTHPCIVPFNQLPEAQQKKDALFCAVVDALAGKDTNLISDGYHTFGELYDHRITLYIALLRNTAQIMDGLGAERVYKNDIWKAKAHSDGSVWDGWFILGINKEVGEQITYHLPMDRWKECDFATELDQAPTWDGHTSADVLQRLKSL